MEKKSTFSLFWSVMATLNVLAMCYPVVLLRRAVSPGAQLLATLLLIGCVFVVIVVDAVTILMAGELAGLKHGNRHTQRTWITPQVNR